MLPEGRNVIQWATLARVNSLSNRPYLGGVAQEVLNGGRRGNADGSAERLQAKERLLREIHVVRCAFRALVVSREDRAETDQVMLGWLYS